MLFVGHNGAGDVRVTGGAEELLLVAVVGAVSCRLSALSAVADAVRSARCTPFRDFLDALLV